MKKIDVTTRTKDTETGYIGQYIIGEDFGPAVRCCRCGGRGMWKPPRQLESPLCLKCFDEWFESDIIKKYESPCYNTISTKRWRAAFAEFLATKPKKIDIQAHNRRIESEDSIIKALFPQYFPKKSN
jgi:hypothetical protein